MTEKELEQIAMKWIISQGYNEENLPSDKLLQMEQAFIAGFLEGIRETTTM